MPPKKQTSILSKLKPNNTKSPALCREEWDFSLVSPSEAQACLYYEYARESSLAHEDCRLWQRHFDTGKPWPDFAELRAVLKTATNEAPSLIRFHSSPVRIIATCPNFPSSPWLRLPLTARQRAMDLAIWSDVEALLTLKKKTPRGGLLERVTTDSFFIDTWAWTDEQLIERFSQWLKANRPLPPEFAPSGRRLKATDLLNHLADFRLCRNAKAVRGSSRKIVEIQKDERNTRRNAEKAQRFIDSFYT